VIRHDGAAEQVGRFRGFADHLNSLEKILINPLTRHPLDPGLPAVMIPGVQTNLVTPIDGALSTWPIVCRSAAGATGSLSARLVQP